ncbi:laccase-like multicopper oxidase 1 [Culex quinquefasciatus]|uniref:Laccase-like multicopper oxidase 1 n=1 Tax=Culex quinquefasciatus TaxID=7176 RepID=B0X9S1_CULQU|nr:laccase-like multicopper oxidase 1 [Culex quinquefasciatus]|eukprot:XP_001866393.1 laccase-like multicopper oxidase 1 [Culex quinquefasciatus]
MSAGSGTSAVGLITPPPVNLLVMSKALAKAALPCELDPAPIEKNIPVPIEEMFQAKIRGVMTESGKQFVTYFLSTKERFRKDKFSADQTPAPCCWNSHITGFLPAAKKNFQTTHGLVQTHPSFEKTGPLALPLISDHEPAAHQCHPPNSAAIPACPLGRVCPSLTRRRTAEDLLLLYRRVLHRAGSCRQTGGRSERSKRFKEVWSKLVDTCFEDVGGMDKTLQGASLKLDELRSRLGRGFSGDSEERILKVFEQAAYSSSTRSTPSEPRQCAGHGTTSRCAAYRPPLDVVTSDSPESPPLDGFTHVVGQGSIEHRGVPDVAAT